MTIWAWLLPGILILAFGLSAFGHAFCLIRYLASRKPFSVIPLFGGLMGCVGFALAPSIDLNRIWWAPLLLDYGSVPTLIVWTVVLLRRAKN